MLLSEKQITKALIRLPGCACRSAHVLFTNPQRQVFSRRCPYVITWVNIYWAFYAKNLLILTYTSQKKGILLLICIFISNIIFSSFCFYNYVIMFLLKWAATWDFQQSSMCDQQSLRSACAYAQSDQSLCLSLEHSMSVKLLTEHHLEFLSLKAGCRDSSESTLVKMPHCWKSHATSHFITAASL